MKTFVVTCILCALAASASAQVTGMRPGQARTITGTATANTATTADYNGLIVWRSTSTAAKTQTLPTCNASASGMTLGVVDGQGNAGTGNISLATPSGTSVSGPVTSITTDRGSLEVTCDGTSTWVVTANNLAGGGGGGSVTAGNVTVNPQIRGQGNAQGALAALDTAIGAGGGGGGEPAWTVVVPSGGDDYNNLQNALNTSRKGVILSANESISDSTRARSFNVCRTIRIPRDKVLIGTRVGHHWGGTEDFGWEQWQGGPLITCGAWFGWSGSSTNQFSTTDCPYNPACAQLAMSSNTTIEGFSVNGFRRPGPDSDWTGYGVCINAVNTKGPTIRFMNVLNCEYSILFAGSGRYNGTTYPGGYFGSDPCCGYAPISQVQVVNNNTIWYVGNGPWFGPDWDGGPSWGAADIRVFANELEIPTITSITFVGTGSGQVHDNRIEDAGGCLEVDRSEHFNIHGNHFNDEKCDFFLKDSHDVQFVDNSAQSQWEAEGSDWRREGCWHLRGNINRLISNSNQCRYGKYGAYYVGSGTSVSNTTLMDGPTGATGVCATEDDIFCPPLFRDRRTTVALTSSEVLHLLPGSRWATAWASSIPQGTNGNTMWCCGAPSVYTPNPNSN